MTEQSYPSVEEILTDLQVEFEGVDQNLADFTIETVRLGESLLTPGLQTSITVHSYRHNMPPKDLNAFKNKLVSIKLTKDLLKKYNLPHEMKLTQRIYRVENRQNINTAVESYTIRACDDTLLNDALSLVSKSWKCTSPSEIVGYVLQSCAGSRSMDIERSDPARDYIAENIHPFQVVAQQANVSLAEGNDPSFVHYMTYQNMGTHHFRSLKTLSQQSPVMTFFETETGIVAGFGFPFSIMAYSFPCDFDLLSDVLNGISTGGKDINSIVVFNPRDGNFSLVGDQTLGCGIGQGVLKIAQTNTNSEGDQDTCNMGVEKYLLKRQARMSLLERDKIALRLTVPFSPILNAGKVIEIDLMNKDALGDNIKVPVYGSGKYLILNMFHEVRKGGYATTTMDCVAVTVGSGEV